MEKVVLAYSGGLDTSVCVPLLRERYGFDHIVTVVVDVGQPESEIGSAETRARAISDEHVTIDATDEFVTDYIFPLIKANGCYEGYVMGTAIARPLIAKKVVEVADEVGATALAHGCTGKGNDQLRFEAVFRATKYRVIAPMRELELTRDWEIKYAEEKGIPTTVSERRPWSVDENLWSRSIEGGRLEDPSFTPPEEIYEWTTPPLRAPDEPETIEVMFERGVPVGLNGEEIDGVTLITELNATGGKHGVGRTDMMEDRVLGLKARENYEHPAATILLSAHADLERLVLTRAELQFKRIVDDRWSELAYMGLMDEPLYRDLNAFIDKTQERVTGSVKLQLYKGSATPIARESPNALYREELVSFESSALHQRDAEGFSKYHGFQARMQKKIMER